MLVEKAEKFSLLWRRAMGVQRERVDLAAPKLRQAQGASGASLEDVLAKEAHVLCGAMHVALVAESFWARDLHKKFMTDFGIGVNLSEFADVVAQTVTYGMTVAWAMNSRDSHFDEIRAFYFLSSISPVLKELFPYFLRSDMPCEVCGAVRSIAEELNGRCHLESRGEMASLYFYERFLRKYSPSSTAAYGVYYTPQEIVKFMIRSSHRLCMDLKCEGAESGLLSDAVKLLDPACGSGAFLLGAVQFLADQNNHIEKKQSAISDLRNKLLGFELLPAAWAAAHIHLENELRKIHGGPVGDSRLSVFLSNSLQKSFEQCSFFMDSIASLEELECGKQNLNSSFPVIIGNPPYRQRSENKGVWIDELMRSYKEGLVEKKNNVDNDYVKFIRMAQHIVERAGKGIVAFITPNAYLNAPTLRVMRKSLLACFDEIRIVNLHGSVTVDEGFVGDENVFGIRQGVCIAFLIKSGRGAKKQNAKVLYSEVVGTRERKFRWLDSSTFAQIEWSVVPSISERCEFLPSARSSSLCSYEKFASIADIFPVRTSGVQTKNDDFIVGRSQSEIENRVRALALKPESELLAGFSSLRDSAGWRVDAAIRHAKELIGSEINFVHPLLYRPFDVRYTVLSSVGSGLVGRPRMAVMKDFLGGEEGNIGLIATRQLSSTAFHHAFVSVLPIDGNAISQRSREYNSFFPLYTRDALCGLFPNLSPAAIAEIQDATGLLFLPEIECCGWGDFFTAFDVLAYVYAVLASSTYREIFFADLKLDFPRIPLGVSSEFFQAMSRLGGDLIRAHAYWQRLDSCAFEGPKQCSLVAQPEYHAKTRRIYLNTGAYYNDVEPGVLEFRVGNFEVVRKWLSERSKAHGGNVLCSEDILELGKILASLSETVRLTQKIDNVVLSHGVFENPFFNSVDKVG